MPYDHDYVCMMKQPVLCELCNKSYAIGVMKKHKQSKMHILYKTADYIIHKYKWSLNMP